MYLSHVSLEKEKPAKFDADEIKTKVGKKHSIDISEELKTYIQKFATDCENKLRSNGYLSESALNADQNKLAKMQFTWLILRREAESFRAV